MEKLRHNLPLRNKIKIKIQNLIIRRYSIVIPYNVHYFQFFYMERKQIAPMVCRVSSMLHTTARAKNTAIAVTLQMQGAPEIQKKSQLHQCYSWNKHILAFEFSYEYSRSSISMSVFSPFICYFLNSTSSFYHLIVKLVQNILVY